MPKSMTGFARADHSADWGNVVCELKSVNHRFLDLSFRMPDSLRAVEHKLRGQVRGQITRGKVECSISVKFNNGSADQMQLDTSVAETYLKAAQEVSQMLGQDEPLNPLEILRMPGVMGSQEVDEQALRELTEKVLEDSLQALGASRKREGDVLGKEVLSRTAKIRELTKGLVEIVPLIRRNYEDKIRQRLVDAELEVNQERLEQELIFIAQKMDIEEEIDRLIAHLDQIDELVLGDQPIGRKLDFLMQELNREANTLGSKSQGLQQTNTSVEMKVLIEQIREQIQNIE